KVEIDDEFKEVLVSVEGKFRQWMENTSPEYWTQVDVSRVLNDAILLDSNRIQLIQQIKSANLFFTPHFLLFSSLSQFLQSDSSESLLALFTPPGATFLGSVVVFQSLQSHTGSSYL